MSKRGEKKSKINYWSQNVSDVVMDIEPGLFTLDDPRKIALGLKRSALRSGSEYPYKSAMSMLCFYINRGGINLSKERVRVLNKAKLELRELFGRD